MVNQPFMFDFDRDGNNIGGLNTSDAWQIILASKADPSRLKDPWFKFRVSQAGAYFSKEYIDTAKPDPDADYSKWYGEKKKQAKKSQSSGDRISEMFNKKLDEEHKRRGQQRRRQ